MSGLVEFQPTLGFARRSGRPGRGKGSRGDYTDLTSGWEKSPTVARGIAIKIKQYYLVAAALVTCAIASLYGMQPRWFAQSLLGMDAVDLNFIHVLRAIMGLYLAFALFWFLAAFSRHLRNTAVLTTIPFIGGLAVGRIVSILLDGVPAGLLVFYTGAEIVLVLLAFWVYRLPD